MQTVAYCLVLARAIGIFYKKRTFNQVPVSPSVGSHKDTSHAPVMLLCLSTGRWGSVLEEPVEAAGEVALQAAGRFVASLTVVNVK